MNFVQTHEVVTKKRFIHDPAVVNLHVFGYQVCSNPSWCKFAAFLAMRKSFFNFYYIFSGCTKSFPGTLSSCRSCWWTLTTTATSPSRSWWRPARSLKTLSPCRYLSILIYLLKISGRYYNIIKLTFNAWYFQT